MGDDKRQDAFDGAVELLLKDFPSEGLLSLWIIYGRRATNIVAKYL